MKMTEHDSVPETGYDAKYLIGYDPQQKCLVEFDANTFGADTFSSETGWENNSLTMTSAPSSDLKAPYLQNRFRYSLQKDQSLMIDWEIRKTANSERLTADHLACTHSN